MRAILRILRLVFSRYKVRLIAGYKAVFGAAASSLAVPRIIGTSANKVLESGDKDISQFYVLAFASLAAGAARGLFAFGQTYIAESTSQKVAYDLRNEYFYRLQHLGYGFHDKQMTGGLMPRATADVEGVRMFINMGAIRAGFIFATILGIAIVTFMMDVKLALVGLSFVPFLAWRAIVSSWVLRRAWMRVQELMGEMTTGPAREPERHPGYQGLGRGGVREEEVPRGGGPSGGTEISGGEELGNQLLVDELRLCRRNRRDPLGGGTGCRQR